MAVDLLIKGALIVDGTGRPGYHGDIAVSRGKIGAIGRTGESASRVIDASGLAAVPGFWDTHTHYDAQLLWDPLATSSVWHGVTTIVTGNCGFTIAPVKKEDQEYLARTLARVEDMDYSALSSTLPWPWERFGEFLAFLEGRIGVNVAPLLGHSAVRRYVMGKQASKRAANEEELREMKAVVRDALRSGAFGLSSTQGVSHWDAEGAPVPSRLANDLERRELASALRGMTRGFLQGMGETRTDEAVAKLVDLTETSGRPHCWPTITQTVAAPDAWKDELAELTRLVAQGRRFFAHCQENRKRFEINFADTNFFARWPAWQRLFSTPVDARKAMMRDPRVRERLREEMKVDPIKVLPLRWDGILLDKSATGRWQRFEGKSITLIASDLGADPLDAAFDIALDEDLKTAFWMPDSRYPNEQVMIDILKSPHVIVGQSDAGAHITTQINTGFPTHMLGYWVRERQAISLEEAVNILATRPADELGVTDRGRLVPGQAADIVLLDLERVRDGERSFVNDLPNGGRRLVQSAQGIEAVLVNGVVVWQGRAATGQLGGQVIRGAWAER